MKYRVIDLGNEWSEESKDWTVGSAHFTPHEVDLSKYAEKIHIMKALKAIGAMPKHLTRRSVMLEAYNDELSSLFIRERRTGKWLWELRPVIKHVMPS